MDYILNYETTFPFVLYSATAAESSARTPVFSRNDYGYCTAEYIRSGSGFLEINGETFHIHKDSVYFLSPGSTHCYYPDRKDPWQKYFFVVNGDLMLSLLKAYQMERVYHIPDCPGLKKYFEEMMNVNCSSETSNQEASLIFHRFLQEASRIQHGMKRALPEEIRMLKYELDSSMERSFSLEHFADTVCFSEAHLIRQFRSHFGMTPYEYLISGRMEQARRLLMYSSLTVKEIAAKLAFADQYYFSNCFKQKNGLSPRDWRNHFQGKK